MEDGHAKTSEEVLKFFGTNEEVGLSADQVKNFQAKYGPNGKLALNLFLIVFRSCLSFIIFGALLPSLLHFMMFFITKSSHMFALGCCLHDGKDKSKGTHFSALTPFVVTRS